MRRLLILLFILCLLSLAVPVLAQDETPVDPQTLAGMVTRAEDAVTRAEEAAARADEVADKADSATGMAFNLLGIFEAIGFLVTVVAGVGALVGITRLLSAQNELTKARERVEAELTESRERFAAEMAAQEAKLNALRDQLTQSADAQRQQTANASLAQSLMPLGERQYRSQDYVGALDTYKRALKLDPNNLIIHYRLGYVYTQSGQLAEAEHHLTHALEIDPEFAPAMAALGYVYRRMGEKMEAGVQRELMLNRAEEKMLAALSLSPKLVDDDGESWWGSLGGLYRRRGQIDQAIYAYEKATEITPHSSYGFSNLALLYVQRHDLKRMRETYSRAEKLAWGEVQADVDNYWAYADLLVSRLALGMVKQADEILDTVLETAPSDSPYTLESLIDTLERLAEILKDEEREPVERVIVYTREFLEKRKASQAAEAEALKRATAEVQGATGD
jgi:tetratricopeptide (TPR) repeat protein